MAKMKSNPFDTLMGAEEQKQELDIEALKAELTEKVKADVMANMPQKPEKADANVPSSKKGLPEGWSRSSYIANDEQSEKVKAIAWYGRSSVKEVIYNALEMYLSSLDQDEVNEAIERYAAAKKRGVK